MDQQFDVKQLEELDSSSLFVDFRSMRMKLAWLANTPPDLLFEISQLVTLERFSSSTQAHWKRLSTAIRYAHVNMSNLKFLKIDRDSIRIVGHSDAAFANNHDFKSQLG